MRVHHTVSEAGNTIYSAMMMKATCGAKATRSAQLYMSHEWDGVDCQRCLNMQEAAPKAEKPGTITAGRNTFKTQRAAENEVGRLIGAAINSRYVIIARDADHAEALANLTQERINSARTIANAIASSIDGYDADAIMAKKFESKAKESRKYGQPVHADAKL